MLGRKSFAYNKDLIKQVFEDSPSVRFPKHDNINNKIIILTSISRHENISRTTSLEGPLNNSIHVIYVFVTSDVMISSFRFVACVWNEAKILFLWHYYC